MFKYHVDVITEMANENIHITDFPEEVDNDGGLRIYGEASYANHMALLSHYLHNWEMNNHEKQSYTKRTEIIDCIRDFLAYKGILQQYTDDEIEHVAENPFEKDLFADFMNIPFFNPVHANFTFVDLFAGIGGIRIPFDELGCQCVFSSEWDKKACQTYFANFGVLPYGDITKIPAELIPQHDLLLAGFPCQSFSIMGKMLGFADTRGTMFFEIERILKYHHTPYILLENVKQLVGHDKGRTFKVILERLGNLGYYVKWKVLNALDFGLPQKRERVIIVGFLRKDDYDDFNFDFTPENYDLNDVLEEDDKVDKTLFASEHIINNRKKQTEGKKIFYPSIWHENKSGNVSVLDYSCALRSGASYNYLLVNGCRRPSSRELLRLQGFPDKFRIVVPYQDIRRQTGNSVAVPMIRMVARKINAIINNRKDETPEIKRWQKAVNQ